MGLARKGWQEHGKRKVVGGSVSRQDRFTRESIQEEGKRSVGLYHHGIFWQRKGKGRGELGSSFLPRMFVSLFIVL
jgi:hypothetical protein